MEKHLSAAIRTYDQAISWLYTRIDYEKVRPPAQSNPFRLERIRRLLERIGSPHLRIPVVHIAGTKGKGSTAAMLESILRQSGIRTGLFTSPHLHRFEERMRINGMMPGEAQITELVSKLACCLEDASASEEDRVPTFFEVTTLLAWMLFEEENVELVVLETGLGGRLDCTNVCVPKLTVITGIGLDHTQILGDTVELIAAEKAGILKEKVPLVLGQVTQSVQDVIAEHAGRTQSEILRLGRDIRVQLAERRSDSSRGGTAIDVLTPRKEFRGLDLPLVGEHQQRNAALAVMSASWLSDNGYPSITDGSIRKGILETVWPLRFEMIAGVPEIILDAAHNVDSVVAVVRTLDELAIPRANRMLLFASSADKDVVGMLRAIVPAFHRVILTRYISNPRSVSVSKLLEMTDELRAEIGDTDVLTADEPEEGLLLARQCSSRGDVICVTGSIFLASEVRALILPDPIPFPVLNSGSERHAE